MGKTSSKQAINFVTRYSIYFITLIFMVICTCMNDRFLTVENIINILRQISVYALLAFAESVCIISGNLDLAAASTLVFSGCMSIFVYTATESLLLAVLVAVLVGVIINTVSGIIVAYFNIPPFVATLGMQMSVRGAVYMLTGGMTITETGENFKVIGQGYVGPVPNPVLIMLLCAVVFWVLLDRTRLGRNFYAVGGNREAARASGISLRKYTIYAYMVAGAFTGLAGIVYCSRINAGTPAGAQGYEGLGIAAAVIGGIGFAGGTGNAWGAVIGAVVIGIINNILNLMGVNSYMQQVINGLVIILAVGLDTFTRSKHTS
ncbi:putative ribose transport system permease protein RbsC [Clostridiales bacterium 1_7_47FAA]|uniref:ABC transporter permease n=1 Tax=Enterocloster hominis (ex Hitch et al. 2024) TaxID=1917870 RepID=A0ABV1D0V8_9FIRM|nr:putative ribose transport system permease protein RbsC [Clostridiales bacterium 1_7_47FAA]